MAQRLHQDVAILLTRYVDVESSDHWAICQSNSSRIRSFGATVRTVKSPIFSAKVC